MGVFAHVVLLEGYKLAGEVLNTGIIHGLDYREGN
jgi:hypothetical protein